MGLNGQFNARIQRLEKIVEDMPSGREVPQPSVADYGKVIGVDENGEYSLENVPQEVPTPGEIDAGKILKVNSSGTGYELSDEGSGLPEYSDADDGKVLTVDGSGTTPELVWGDSGLPECGIDDIGKVLTVVPLYSQIPVFSNQSGTIRSDGSVKISTFAINPVLHTIPNGKHGTLTSTLYGEAHDVDVVYDSSTYSFSNDDFGLSIVFNNVFDDEAWIINGYGSDNEGLEVTATLKYDGLIYGATPSWQRPSTVSL